MALPTFFVIGAAKSGTSSLHSYLAQHPEVQMSANKEPRFFAGPDNGIPYPPDKIWDRDDYERLFDPSFPVRGESSTDYAAHPRRQGSAERIKELVPEAKFVYLVRDPVARTISHYKMGVALMGERRPLEEALEDINPASPYVASSLYATQIELYLQYFPDEQMLILDHGELLSDRPATLRRIFAFLGVDPEAGQIESEEKLLDSAQWRTYSPEYLGFVNRYVTPRVRWVPRGFRRSVRRTVERVLYPPLETPTLDGEVGDRLRATYAEEANRLRQLTGLEFASWSV
jgi:sulfotransferase family protein